MPKEMMYGEAIATAIIEEMQRDSSVIFYGQNMGMTERDPMLKMFGKDRIRPAAYRGIVDERIHAGGL